jgi:DNA repair protein RecO (recombination protein O)
VSTEKAAALVIRQVDFSESSRIVTVFSREFGKLSALAKGAKRLKGPFDAALDLLSMGRIVFIRKSAGTLNLLTEARLTSRFRPPNADLMRLYAGYYVADLLNGLTEDFDPHPVLFDHAVRTLDWLSDPRCPSALSIVSFEVVMLREIGLLPNLEQCSACGAPIDVHGQFAHWVSQGGLLCAECRREEYAHKSVSAEAIRFLRSLAAWDAETPPEAPEKQSTISQSHQIVVSAISNVLGRKPGTLRYLKI